MQYCFPGPAVHQKMKRKCGPSKCKPTKKPQIAAAAAEGATSTFLNSIDCSQWDGNDGVDFTAEAETAHAARHMNGLSTECEEEGFLGNMDPGDSVPNTNLLKNFANFAAKLSRNCSSTSSEPINNSFSVHIDKMCGTESRVSPLDPLNNEQELNAALLVIKTVMKMDAAKPFNIPVDPTALGIPDYFDIIDTPMDFGTICNNLEWGGKYRNSKEVFNDVQLIWDNCSKYNKKGDYILYLMKRVRINFMKHWNAAGLFRQEEEVDHGSNQQDAVERNARNNNDRNGFQSGSKISNSIPQERWDFTSLNQMQDRQCSPCTSLTQPQYIPRQYQCRRQSIGIQSLHPQSSGYHATTETTNGHSVNVHKHQGVGSSGINKSQLPDCNRLQKEISHHPSPSCGSKHHLNERLFKYQSNCSHHHSTKPTGPNSENAEPNVKHTRGSKLGYLAGPARGCSSHQKQCPNGHRELPQSSIYHSNSHPWSSQAHFVVGLPETHQPQDLAKTGHAEESSHMPMPAESTLRHASCQHAHSGLPVTRDSSDHEECEMDPSGSHSPSSDQSNKPREHGTQNLATPSKLGPLVPQDCTRVVRKTQGRGPTRCLKLLNEEGNRISITTNELGQPVGPDAPKLISFLGTLARNGHMAPLTFVNWKAMPDENKENMWQEVQLRFEIDPNSKRWVMKSLSNKWKNWKSMLKTKHYIPHTTDEERIADRDKRVLPDQWVYLVSYWSSESAKKRSATNKANRAKVKFEHVTGTKSFARIREEQQAKRPDGKALSRAELFILTRTRKDGKPVNEASSAVITQLHGITNQQNGTIGCEDDEFSQIIGRNLRGRIRCEGLAPFSEFGREGPSKMEAIKLVAKTTSEVSQMKGRLEAMEQTCAQMAQQMATMISMMASMQKDCRDENVPPEAEVNDVCTHGGGTPEQQGQTGSLRRSSRRRNI